jgi:hypothetical protein
LLNPAVKADWAAARTKQSLCLWWRNRLDLDVTWPDSVINDIPEQKSGLEPFTVLTNAHTHTQIHTHTHTNTHTHDR